MKKILVLIGAIFALFVFSGCVSTNENGTVGVKGIFSNHVYTKDDYETVKDGYIVVRNGVGKVVKILKKVDGKLIEVDQKVEELRTEKE